MELITFKGPPWRHDPSILYLRLNLLRVCSTQESRAQFVPKPGQKEGIAHQYRET